MIQRSQVHRPGGQRESEVPVRSRPATRLAVRTPVGISWPGVLLRSMLSWRRALARSGSRSTSVSASELRVITIAAGHTGLPGQIDRFLGLGGRFLGLAATEQRAVHAVGEEDGGKPGISVGAASSAARV